MWTVTAADIADTILALFVVLCHMSDSAFELAADLCADYVPSSSIFTRYRRRQDDVHIARLQYALLRLGDHLDAHAAGLDRRIQQLEERQQVPQGST